MRKIVRTRAAKQIADQLIPAETALDQALISMTRLIETSVNARMDAQMPLSCGHQAIKGMSSVINLITQARDEMVDVHADLAETKILVSLREVSFGDMGGCPPVNAENTLTVVSLAG